MYIYMYVIHVVIAQGQGFMAVNRPESHVPDWLKVMRTIAYIHSNNL